VAAAGAAHIKFPESHPLLVVIADSCQPPAESLQGVVTCLISTPGYVQWKAALKHRRLRYLVIAEPSKHELAVMAALAGVPRAEVTEKMAVMGCVPRFILGQQQHVMSINLLEEGLRAMAQILEDSNQSATGPLSSCYTAYVPSTVMVLERKNGLPGEGRWRVREEVFGHLVRQMASRGSSWIQKIMCCSDMWLLAPLRGHIWEAWILAQLVEKQHFKRRLVAGIGADATASGKVECWHPLGEGGHDARAAWNYYKSLAAIPNSARIQIPQNRSHAVIDVVVLGAPGEKATTTLQGALVQTTIDKHNQVTADNLVTLCNNYREMHSKHGIKGPQNAALAIDLVYMVPPADFMAMTAPAITEAGAGSKRLRSGDAGPGSIWQKLKMRHS
jgi:hypothetical protein